MKQITFALFFMALAIVLNAQDVHFGITAGANLSTAKFDDSYERTSRVAGLQIGAFAEVPLASRFNFRPELQFNALGYKFPAEEGISGIKVKTSYLTVPLLAQYAIIDKFKIELGPHVAMYLSGKSKRLPFPGEEDEYDDDQLTYTKIEEGFRSPDFGVGGGLRYQLSPKLGVGVRYNTGLTNILSEEAPDNAKAVNRYFSLGVSYSIR